MRSCNCLNILIETEANDFQKVNQEILNLTEEEKNDSYFKQDLQKIGKLININKVLSGLIQTRIVGSWTIDKCINCDVETHAVHREKGASCVLIVSKLLTNDAIAKLKTSGLVSTIYNIIVNPNDVEPDDNSLDTYLLPQDIQQTIKSIAQVSSDLLRKETLALEDRIRKFKEEQYDRLNTLKDKAFKEQQSLVKVIRSTIKKDSLSDSTNKSLQRTGLSPRLNEPLSPGKYAQTKNQASSNKYTPKRQRSTPISQTASFDAEGLFDFEGLDEPTSVSNSDVDDSDKDDREDGVKIPRGRAGSVSIAKSLPVNIPAFMPPRYQETDDLDEIKPQNPMDIAANMQALAKSVHGDAVFGDLPRPRFSTQY